MRGISHGSWVKVVREAVEEWRVREGWSRETVCAEFVEEFASTERPNAWNIEFSNHHDIIQRQKNDADKIMRWLDDVSKDNNLLGLNFAGVIMRRLPMDLRIRCTGQMLASIGLTVQLADDAEEGDLSFSDVLAAQIEHAKALQAVTAVCQNPTLENIEAADIHLTQAVARQKFLSKVVGSLKARMVKAKNKTGAVLHKFTHRKDKVIA